MAPLPASPSLLDALSAVFDQMGADPRAWALGMARATPAVTLVPAFGLSAVPAPTRLVLALALGACIAPALAAEVNGAGPFVLALAREALAGLPVALLAALSIYVAGMAGGLVDDLRAARESVSLPSLPEQLPPVAALFTLLASLAFLETGGAARVASALATPEVAGHFSWLTVTKAFARSVELAFALAAPLAVASVLIETAGALVARAATPAFIGPVLAPVKSVALLGLLALMFERIAELLVVTSGFR
ncbi:MAG: Flagellar biosynthesis protein FliR [Polyangiaceae bacterium]|nr:Flagellar biosynthesis protein FliR [Polyangiaceae bacterium]